MIENENGIKKGSKKLSQKNKPPPNGEKTAPLGDKQDLYRLLIQMVPIPLFLRDANGGYIACNSAFERMVNLPQKKIIGKTDYDLFPVELADKEIVKDQELLIHLGRQRYELHFDKPFGGMRDILVEKAPAIDTTGKMIGVAGAVLDISEMRMLENNFEESINRLEALLNALPVAIVVIDHKTRKVIDLNPQAILLLGYTREKIAGRKCRRLICGNSDDRCPIDNPEEKSEQWESFVMDVSGRRIPVLKSIILTEIDGNKVILECFSDISKQKVLENQLREMAETDFLTGLFNRRHFFERTEKEVSRSKRYHHPVSIMMLDIDYFKRINDQFGHAAGDAVLKGIGKLCLEAIRDTDFVGRIGGEEFAVVLIESDLEGAHMVAERIRSRVASHSFQIEDKTIQCSISIGVSELALKEDNLEKIMKRADDALYRAKNTGRNQTCRG